MEEAESLKNSDMIFVEYFIYSRFVKNKSKKSLKGFCLAPKNHTQNHNPLTKAVYLASRLSDLRRTQVPSDRLLHGLGAEKPSDRRLGESKASSLSCETWGKTLFFPRRK